MGLGNKQIRMMFFLLLCSILYVTWMVADSQSKLSNEDFIRFHVIANSDSEADQQLKLKVRDGILAKINSGLVQETMAQEVTTVPTNGDSTVIAKDGRTSQVPTKVSLSMNESREYLLNNIDEIQKEAGRIVRENGYDYPVKAEMGVRWIPQKSYGNTIFPSGNYEALNITIGSGKGHNWWCVLFPPLCLIGAEPSDDPELAKEAQELYQDVLLDKKYEPLLENNKEPTTLKLKFKTLELIDELDKQKQKNPQ